MKSYFTKLNNRLKARDNNYHLLLIIECFVILTFVINVILGDMMFILFQGILLLIMRELRQNLTRSWQELQLYRLHINRKIIIHLEELIEIEKWTVRGMQTVIQVRVYRAIQNEIRKETEEIRESLEAYEVDLSKEAIVGQFKDA